MHNSLSDLRPVFMVGAHRSGTTLLRLMLDHHPDISVPGEYDFLTEIMADRMVHPTGSEYLQHVGLHRGFLAQSFDVDSRDSYEALVRSFVHQLSERNPSRVFVAVVHTGFSELARIWPEAKFIHLVRDPRDVAASAVKLGWAGNVYTGVRRWMTAESEWNKLSAIVSPTHRIAIQFEELISNLEPTLHQLCSFLDLPYCEEMLNYHLDTTYEPPDPTLTNQWKRKLSPTEIGLVEGAIGDLLQDKGYQSSGHKVVRPSRWTKNQLLLQDRFARFRFRLKRFGVMNTVGVALARRMNLHGIERKFQLQINEISSQSLK